MLRSRALLLSLLLCILGGCYGSSNPPPAPTAMDKPKAESELAFITMDAKSAASSHIQTQSAALQEVHQVLTLTGWIMAKPGQEVTLTAPSAGYVHFTRTTSVPIAGESVQPDQLLLELQPVPTPLEQIQLDSLKRTTESELTKAQTTFKNTQSEWERIRDLHEKNLRSKQDLEQAQKARDLAQEEIAAARDKLTYFKRPNLVLKAPQAGIVLQLHVGPGQYVPVAAPLVTLIDLNPIWIRVPVPEFDLPLVDPKQKVSISWKNALDDAPKSPREFPARPTGRVAQVDPNKHTADLWFELLPTKESERFVKDQMVTVQLPIRKKQKATIVPPSAIVYDAHGNPWIYLDRSGEKDSRRKYERRRIEVAASIDQNLLIRPSLRDGEKVVTQGAAVLFSSEFHKPPLTIPAEKE